MDSNRFDVADFIGKRLDEMAKYPKLWGSAEAFEFQFLQLLEIQAIRDNRTSTENGIRWIQRQYVSFVNSIRPGTPPQPLSFILKDDLAALADILSKFRNHLTGQARDRSSASPQAPKILGLDGVATSHQPPKASKAA
ncbi:MAG: hypothetical protein AAB215_07870 [Planctomycetota bacterium]